MGCIKSKTNPLIQISLTKNHISSSPQDINHFQNEPHTTDTIHSFASKYADTPHIHTKIETNIEINNRFKDEIEIFSINKCNNKPISDFDQKQVLSMFNTQNKTVNQNSNFNKVIIEEIITPKNTYENKQILLLSNKPSVYMDYFSKSQINFNLTKENGSNFLNESNVQNSRTAKNKLSFVSSSISYDRTPSFSEENISNKKISELNVIKGNITLINGVEDKMLSNNLTFNDECKVEDVKGNNITN
jgi:hypothetical protein